MESLWRKQSGKLESKKADRPELKREDKAAEKVCRDVIVIGGGMAGILAAWYLQEAGKQVLVLEADEIASGQTERTTAKITSQHGLKYDGLIRKVGVKKAKLYAQANEEAVSEYERLIQEKGIECQFERVPAYLYTTQNTVLLEEEAKAASSLGIDAFYTTETELPFPVTGAVCFRNQARFSPLEFLGALASELEIWEHTKVLTVRGHKVVTENAELTAEQIIAATHYPLRNVPGFYFMRQHQERSYVLALSGCQSINGMYYGIDRGDECERPFQGNVLQKIPPLSSYGMWTCVESR